MSDVDDLVAALVRDSDRLRLPPPSALRATGDARTRRHVIAVVSVAVLVFAVLGEPAWRWPPGGRSRSPALRHR